MSMIAQVVIAAGIGLATLMYAMQSNQLAGTLNKKTTLTQYWDGLVGLIRTAYSDPVLCSNMFAGVTLTDQGNGSLSANLSELGLKSSPSDSGLALTFLAV